MNVTIPDVMRHVRNHFVSSRIDHSWQVAGGRLLPETYFRPGEWIAILDGPARGVWQLDENGAIPGAGDAVWAGRICLLEPPEGFLRLCGEIARWCAAHPDPAMTSERFGEYSRSQTGGGWTRVFASSLAPYTRMYTEVNL